MTPLKVLFASSEVAPFVKVGGLADVVGALPKTLVAQGVDARVILPLYKKIKQKRFDELSFVGWKMVKMGWRSLYAGLYKLESDGVTFYFIDNEYYFNFDDVYIEYTFDIERYCFYQRAVLDFLGDFMQFEPDVLHCNDWQTGMIPLLLDAHYKSNGFHKDIKTVFTIHNLKYQGVHGVEAIADMLDLPDYFMKDEFCIKDDAVNFMKAGIVYSYSVTTVSPTYAYEIMTDYYGEGLNDTLKRYAYKVGGILNGINTDEFNPETDALIPAKFSFPDYKDGKGLCKKAVQEQLGLSVNPGAPLCVMVSRLVDQKGLDLLIRVLDEMLYDGMQVVILGTGQKQYEEALVNIANANREKMCACITYDEGMAHTLYAGADIYLMPSLFEPCGLSQMIAMRYGTIPVARETGGLKDTVIPYNAYTGEGNGFTFANINAHEFLFMTKYACDLYRHHKDVWDKLVAAAMQGDYSWDKSASEYAGLYSYITGIPIKKTTVVKNETAKSATISKTRTQTSKAKQPAKKAPAKSTASSSKANDTKKTTNSKTTSTVSKTNNKTSATVVKSNTKTPAVKKTSSTNTKALKSEKTS